MSQFFVVILDSERSDECIDFIMMCVLDSERSGECINFTMMCVFFLFFIFFCVCYHLLGQ